LPENASTSVQDIQSLSTFSYYFTAGGFILVAATMIAFLVMYRYREGRRARYTHGNTAVEIVWTVVPTLILVVLTVLSLPAWARLKLHGPPGGLETAVMAKLVALVLRYP